MKKAAIIAALASIALPGVAELPSPILTFTGDDDGMVMLHWEMPPVPEAAPRNYDMESYAPFAIDRAADWGFIDGDRLSTIAPTREYPGKGSPMAFQVWDNEELRLGRGNTRSGTQCLVSFAPAEGAAADDWLISPLLGDTFVSFYARCYRDDRPESFAIYASDGGTLPDDFVEIDGPVTLDSNQWTLFSYQLPYWATRFAIRRVSDNGYALMLDDIALTPEPLPDPIGYNVYRDGALCNPEPLSTSTFIDDEAGTEPHVYHVTAVFPTAESAPSGGVTANTTSLDHPEVAPEHKTVRIYDLEGRLVYSGHHDSHRRARLRTGFYIIDGEKVFVKGS